MMDYCKGKVSIIIGLYNVAGFLEKKRLSCILHQSWRNIEIILVNDGSTDRTPDICRQLKSEDPRILLIDKPNGGLGSARNAGLEVASGEYVWFYDVDDDVDTDLVEKNVLWMKEYRVDMTIFGMRFTYAATGYTEPSHFKEHLIESNEELKAVFVDELLIVPNGNGFVINKFYRRDFIERAGARFGWQRIQQDELFNLKLYPKAERLFVSPEQLYHYYIYDSGNNRSRFIPDRILIYESIFDGFMGIRSDWGLTDDRLESYIYHRFYQGIDNSILFNAFHPDAPSSLTWRRREILGILARPKVRCCLGYFSKNGGSHIEGRLLGRAYRSSNYTAICFYRAAFRFLRKVKHTFFSTIPCVSNR